MDASGLTSTGSYKDADISKYGPQFAWVGIGEKDATGKMINISL